VDPTVPVVLMSGFTDGEKVARLGGDESVGFVSKPFGTAELFAAVRDAIEE
jgi:FixJ family two-component response regulator